MPPMISIAKSIDELDSISFNIVDGLNTNREYALDYTRAAE